MITYRTISEAKNFIVLDKYNREWQIAEGLPYEIVPRQKQYEHYGDLLLNSPQFSSPGGVAGEA